MLNHQLWFQRNKCDRILKNIFALISELIDWCYHLLILCSNVHFVKQRFTVKFNLLSLILLVVSLLFPCFCFLLWRCAGGSGTSNMNFCFTSREEKNVSMSCLMCSWLNAQINKILHPGGGFFRFCLISQYKSEGLFRFLRCKRRKIDTADHIPDGVDQLICVTLALNFCPNSH